MKITPLAQVKGDWTTDKRDKVHKTEIEHINDRLKFTFPAARANREIVHILKDKLLIASNFARAVAIVINFNAQLYAVGADLVISVLDNILLKPSWVINITTAVSNVM